MLDVWILTWLTAGDVPVSHLLLPVRISVFPTFDSIFGIYCPGCRKNQSLWEHLSCLKNHCIDLFIALEGVGGYPPSYHLVER